MAERLIFTQCFLDPAQCYNVAVRICCLIQMYVTFWAARMTSTLSSSPMSHLVAMAIDSVLGTPHTRLIPGTRCGTVKSFLCQLPNVNYQSDVTAEEDTREMKV